MKKKLISIAAVSVCAIAIAFLMKGGSNLRPKVTTQNIRMITLGMTRDKVISILGEPFDQKEHESVSTYSRPVDHVRWYPMLWVHYDDDKVREVYAKRYILWGIDDEGVYGLSKGTNNGKPWENSGFERTFPKRSNQAL